MVGEWKQWDPNSSLVPFWTSDGMVLSSIRIPTHSAGILEITPSHKNSTMQQVSGHRENFPRVTASSPGGHSKKMTAVVDCDTRVSTGLNAGHSDTSSNPSTPSPSPKLTQKLSTDDKSIKSTVMAVPADDSSNSNGTPTNSVLKGSIDNTFVYNPKKRSSSIEVHLSEASDSPMTSPFMPVEQVGQKGKSVTLGPCPCEQDDCTMLSPRITTRVMAIESIGRKRVPLVPPGFGVCPCGEEDCMASSSKMATRPTSYEYAEQNRKGMVFGGGRRRQPESMVPYPLVDTPRMEPMDSIEQEVNPNAFDHCPCGQDNCIVPRPQITPTSAQPDGNSEQKGKAPGLDSRPSKQGDGILQQQPQSTIMTDGSSEQKGKAPAFENHPSGQDDCIPQRLVASTPPHKTADLVLPSPKNAPDDQKDERPSPLGWYRTTLRNNPVDCDFLKFCRDFRAEPDNDHAKGGWSIQEGSLVIGINPAYIVPAEGVQPNDQLELKEGTLYMVQQIYGDMWALCLEFSTTKPHGGGIPGAPNEVVGLGFVPLCAVTLAANYATFLDRRRDYRRNPDKVLLTPSNRARVIPPVRIQSFAVSREMHYQVTKGQNNFVSKEAYKICERFRPIGEDDPAYEPKDRMKRLKLLLKNPCRALKKLTTPKLEVKASWVGPDSVPSQPHPRKKLVKGEHRSLDIIGGVKRLCGKIRGT